MSWSTFRTRWQSLGMASRLGGVAWLIAWVWGVVDLTTGRNSPALAISFVILLVLLLTRPKPDKPPPGPGAA
jgi:hypothetical protein